MRTFALVLPVLAAFTAPALADDEGDDDEDAAYEPLPRRSLAAGIQVHTTRIGGRGESGVGPVLDVSIGRGRWQYALEGSFATAGMDDWTTPATVSRVGGRMLRAALGARWVARQFTPSSHAAIELLLLSGIGVQRLSFEGGSIDGQLTRPEVSAGFGLQGRILLGPRLAFRIDARAVFTPNDRESALVACRGNCMMETGSSTGFLTGVALAW